jgi:hypothetical protein
MLRVLKWPILYPIFPRLILIAFTFCQPPLVSRLLTYLQEPPESQNANVGYGLIGAYGVVYFGMAVSPVSTYLYHDPKSINAIYT